MNTVNRSDATVPECLRQLRCLLVLSTAWLAFGTAYAIAPSGRGSVVPALQDIHDIRPPFHISQQWLWFTGILGCCLLAGLGVAAWRWQRGRALARRLLAHEIALRRLREAQALMLPWLARDFSITVTGILRGYIEQRFEIRAAHRTTPEFLRDCLAQCDGQLQQNREVLGVFLKNCDLAKFARWVLTVPEMQSLLASAVDFVTATAQPDPVVAGKGHTAAAEIAASQAFTREAT